MSEQDQSSASPSPVIPHQETAKNSSNNVSSEQRSPSFEEGDSPVRTAPHVLPNNNGDNNNNNNNNNGDDDDETDQQQEVLAGTSEYSKIMIMYDVEAACRLQRLEEIQQRASLANGFEKVSSFIVVASTLLKEHRQQLLREITDAAKASFLKRFAGGRRHALLFEPPLPSVNSDNRVRNASRLLTADLLHQNDTRIRLAMGLDELVENDNDKTNNNEVDDASHVEERGPMECHAEIVPVASMAVILGMINGTNQSRRGGTSGAEELEEEDDGDASDASGSENNSSESDDGSGGGGGGGGRGGGGGGGGGDDGDGPELDVFSVSDKQLRSAKKRNESDIIILNHTLKQQEKIVKLRSLLKSSTSPAAPPATSATSAHSTAADYLTSPVTRDIRTLLKHMGQLARSPLQSFVSDHCIDKLVEQEMTHINSLLHLDAKLMQSCGFKLGDISTVQYFVGLYKALPEAQKKSFVWIFENQDAIPLTDDDNLVTTSDELPDSDRETLIRVSNENFFLSQQNAYLQSKVGDLQREVDRFSTFYASQVRVELRNHSCQRNNINDDDDENNECWL